MDTSENFQMRLFKAENSMKAARGAKHIGFERVESEPRTSQTESEKFFDWTIREMPRSWRLEVQISESPQPNEGFKNSARFLTLHGSLLRQLHGLTRGHFSLMELPTALLKGPAALSGVYEDRDMSDDLAGADADEKRVFNHALRETVRLFLSGIESWPEFPCPLDDRKVSDRWSIELWRKDQATMAAAFQEIIQPLRTKR